MYENQASVLSYSLRVEGLVEHEYHDLNTSSTTFACASRSSSLRVRPMICIAHGTPSIMSGLSVCVSSTQRGLRSATYMVGCISCLAQTVRRGLYSHDHMVLCKQDTVITSA